MAATISEEEFQRIQTQLLDLKTINYSLEEKCKKQEAELNAGKMRYEQLEKELHKFQGLAKLNPLSFAKTFQLNKTAKEKEILDQMVQENENLQRKMQLQEEEFQLTNKTLQEEIQNLLKENAMFRQNISKLHKQKLTDKALKESDLNNKKEISNQDQVDCEDYFCSEITLMQSPTSSEKISFSVLQEKEQLEAQVCEQMAKTTLLEEIQESTKKELETCSKKLAAVSSELEQKIKENTELLKKNADLSGNTTKCEKELLEFRELAEKRKLLIDELKDEIEELSEQTEIRENEANKKAASLKTEITKEMNLLKATKNDLQSKLESMSSRLEKLHQLEQENIELKYEADQLRENLNLVEKQLLQKTAYQKTLDEWKVLHSEELEKISNQHHLELTEMKERLSNAEQIHIELNEKIKKAQQALEDQIEERKIHEKKGVMYVRELKKQLNNEKRQKEKLQERFGDLLSEGPMDVNAKNFDTTSVGSWSFLSTSKENAQANHASSFSIHSSNEERDISSHSPLQIEQSFSSASFAQNQLLEQENAVLVTRITQLQQEKWSLEERLNQTIMNSNKLNEQLEEKCKLISFYCMERRVEPRLCSASASANTEKFTVKKVVDFIKDKGDDNLKEINRRLQRMLEETLIKNMHLQTNLETLTQEIHASSKKL